MHRSVKGRETKGRKDAQNSFLCLRRAAIGERKGGRRWDCVRCVTDGICEYTVQLILTYCANYIKPTLHILKILLYRFVIHLLCSTHHLHERQTVKAKYSHRVNHTLLLWQQRSLLCGMSGNLVAQKSGRGGYLEGYASDCGERHWTLAEAILAWIGGELKTSPVCEVSWMKIDAAALGLQPATQISLDSVVQSILRL